MRSVEFVAMLTPEDRYRHFHRGVGKRVVEFRVQYETRLGGEWYPVVRYDTAHGFAYRDLIDRCGRQRKTPIFAKSLNEALIFAEYDIKSNWQMYERNFLRGENP